MLVIYYSYLTVLYFIDNCLQLCGFVFNLAMCLLHCVFLIPLFLSALSLFVCSHRNEFLNKKTVVTCACIEPGAVKPELLTKQGNIDSALHVSYVGGGGISSSIMSFLYFCTNCSGFVALTLSPCDSVNMMMPSQMHLSGVILCFVHCIKSGCLVFSYTFFYKLLFNMCECVYV